MRKVLLITLAVIGGLVLAQGVKKSKMFGVDVPQPNYPEVWNSLSEADRRFMQVTYRVRMERDGVKCAEPLQMEVLVFSDGMEGMGQVQEFIRRLDAGFKVIQPSEDPTRLWVYKRTGSVVSPTFANIRWGGFEHPKTRKNYILFMACRLKS